MCGWDWEALCTDKSFQRLPESADCLRMGHSVRCHDLKTRWDRENSRCVPCQFKPGHEINPNCGFDDDGGRHETPFALCKQDTFNDGSWAYCRQCSRCQPEHYTVIPCNPTTDTQCRESRPWRTEVPVTTNRRSSLPPTATTRPSELSRHPASLYVLCALQLAILTVTLVSFVIYVKRKRGQQSVLRKNRRSSCISAEWSSLSASNHYLEDILSPTILSAPLQTVLDNLDVLEDLVILLDPDNCAVKNTKHLASHCSFPSNWITYTYSMKDSKSPLKALLESVTSKHPEWTVGHLAKMLRLMERNDAIAVLSKLRLNVLDV